MAELFARFGLWVITVMGAVACMEQFVVPAFAADLPQVDAASDDLAWCTALDGAVLRAEASPTSKRIELVPFGTKVKLLPNQDGAKTSELTLSGWTGRYASVLVGEKSGFIFDAFLSREGVALYAYSYAPVFGFFPDKELGRRARTINMLKYGDKVWTKNYADGIDKTEIRLNGRNSTLSEIVFEGKVAYVPTIAFSRFPPFDAKEKERFLLYADRTLEKIGPPVMELICGTDNYESVCPKEFEGHYVAKQNYKGGASYVSSEGYAGYRGCLNLPGLSLQEGVMLTETAFLPLTPTVPVLAGAEHQYIGDLGVSASRNQNGSNEVSFCGIESSFSHGNLLVSVKPGSICWENGD